MTVTHFQQSYNQDSKYLLFDRKHCPEWFPVLSNEQCLKQIFILPFSLSLSICCLIPIVPESGWFWFVIAINCLDVPKSPNFIFPEMSLKIFAPRKHKGKLRYLFLRRNQWRLHLISRWMYRFSCK